jgi:adenylate cyclase
LEAFLVWEAVKRKLSAILSADVKEYSRLMSQDERGTIRTLNAYKEAMSVLIQEYKGRVVDSPGDNLLAEFGSVVDAVNCAVEVQRELAERNAALPPARQMEFRIGINLGDVVEEKGRIYGDGVNIAARVEGLAEGGGICISGTVYDQVKNKLGLEYEYLGEQTVKNIPEPVRIYRVLSFPGAAAHRVVQAKSAVARKWLVVCAIITVLILAAAAGLIWNVYFRLPAVGIISERKMAFTLPEGPSVAVLPFVNMSGDPEQEYFSDGLTENIITALSVDTRLFVIARNSTFTYKGKSVKVQEVAHELGAEYVVEGSVQKAKDRVRITVQLINANTGHHIWADKYDRDLKDIFAVQDEITMKIITALGVKLAEGEQARFRAGRSDNLEVYMKGMKALGYFRRMNAEDNILARHELEEAIALAPESAPAYALLAMTYLMDVYYGSSESPLISFAQASKFLKKAIALDNENSDAHLVLANLYLIRREHGKAIAAAERAIALNRNGADAYANLGYILSLSGRSDEAIEFFEKAIRLNPIPPSHYLHQLGIAYRNLGRYDEAMEAYKKALQRSPTNLFAHLGLAATYISLGRAEEAHNEAAEIARMDPKFSLEQFEKTMPFKNKADNELFIENLRKAGLK